MNCCSAADLVKVLPVTEGDVAPHVKVKALWCHVSAGEAAGLGLLREVGGAWRAGLQRGAWSGQRVGVQLARRAEPPPTALARAALGSMLKQVGACSSWRGRAWLQGAYVCRCNARCVHCGVAAVRGSARTWSSISQSAWPCCCSRVAAPRPVGPAPRMRIDTCGVVRSAGLRGGRWRGRASSWQLKKDSPSPWRRLRPVGAADPSC